MIHTDIRPSWLAFSCIVVATLILVVFWQCARPSRIVTVAEPTPTIEIILIPARSPILPPTYTPTVPALESLPRATAMPSATSTATMTPTPTETPRPATPTAAIQKG